MPLCGLDTGYVDIDVDGTLGRRTTFNHFVFPREIGGLPFLDIAVDGRTHLLTTKNVADVENANQIHYWGHYPVADVEYEIKSPVS